MGLKAETVFNAYADREDGQLPGADLRVRAGKEAQPSDSNAAEEGSKGGADIWFQGSPCIDFRVSVTAMPFWRYQERIPRVS